MRPGGEAVNTWVKEKVMAVSSNQWRLQEVGSLKLTTIDDVAMTEVIVR